MSNKSYFMSDTPYTLAPFVDEYLRYLDDHYSTQECQVFFNDLEKADRFFKRTKNLFLSFASHDDEKVYTFADSFAKTAFDADIPYVIVNNLVETFKNAMTTMLLERADKTNVREFLGMIVNAEKAVAQHYLTYEVNNFLRHNHMRIESIHEIVHQSVMYFYEAHLNWLNAFANSIISLDVTTLPQLHPDRCDMGKWLKEDASELISNSERFETLDRIHRNLHLIAKRAELVMKTEPVNYHYLMMLLKNADRFSLSIGLELAIINNVEYIKHSSKDPLTGTLNRQLFYNIFRNQFDISKAVERSFGIIMTDLDDFKQINDRYGHTVGDQVLQNFAQLLIDGTRKSDFVIRYGGEEFIILLPVATLNETTQIAEKLRKRTEALTVDTPDGPVSLTSSFGITAITPEDDTVPSQDLLKSLIEEVDSKLYMAKKCGKNRVI
jgi:diguanylate cyclase (GGDEF)-like protein